MCLARHCRLQRRQVGQDAGQDRGASVAAGFAGSAFHAVLLCRGPRTRLRILHRPSVSRLHYDLVARARGLDLRHLQAPLRATGPLHAWTTFEIVDIDAAVEAIEGASE
jgi:hypothetical protein